MPRKPIEIDWKVVDALCSVGATLWEICQVIGVDEKTLNRACRRDHKLSISIYHSRLTARVTVNLRRWQLSRAEGGETERVVWGRKKTKKPNGDEVTEMIPHKIKVRVEGNVQMQIWLGRAMLNQNKDTNPLAGDKPPGFEDPMKDDGKFEIVVKHVQGESKFEYDQPAALPAPDPTGD